MSAVHLAAMNIARMCGMWGELVDEQLRLAGSNPPLIENIIEYTAREDLDRYASPH